MFYLTFFSYGKTIHAIEIDIRGQIYRTAQIIFKNIFSHYLTLKILIALYNITMLYEQYIVSNINAIEMNMTIKVLFLNKLRD